ncbi:MAG: hypothetical protein V1743_07775 [Nanoarchaeota archaeon]
MKIKRPLSTQDIALSARVLENYTRVPATRAEQEELYALRYPSLDNIVRIKGTPISRCSDQQVFTVAQQIFTRAYEIQKEIAEADIMNCRNLEEFIDLLSLKLLDGSVAWVKISPRNVRAESHGRVTYDFHPKRGPHFTYLEERALTPAVPAQLREGFRDRTFHKGMNSAVHPDNQIVLVWYDRFFKK